VEHVAQQIDVVTFGETMVIMNPAQHLPLEYVHQFHNQIGGAESNVAIGLQRLGHTVGWFSKLGDDPFGRYILRFVRGEGVDTSRCLIAADEDAPTGLFFKERKTASTTQVHYYRKHSAASRLSPDDLDRDYIAQAKMLFVTGITPALSASCEKTVFEAIRMAKEHQVQVVFDPNMRWKLWSKAKAREVMQQMARLADVILPGLDEGQLITGMESPEDIARALLHMEPEADKLIVIKLGEAGAYYRTREQEGYVSGYEVDEIADPVGAGDGFAAGIMSGLLHDEPLEKIVQKANAIGAHIVQTNGDVEGFPSRQDIEQTMSHQKERDVTR
jgi:2-dehydro-3-deoxygluconokinase